MKRQHWLFLVSLVLTVIVGALLIAQFYGDSEAAAPQTIIQAVIAQQLDDDYNPINPTGEYGPTDTFYLSVRIEQAPAHSIISARWRYGEQEVLTQDQVIGALDDRYVLGFELARTDDRWPAGDYAVDILLNGSVVGSAEFVVMP
jgi:hypothetical protein